MTVTALLFFVAPALLLGAMVLVVAVMAYIPGFETLAPTVRSQLMEFCAVFGGGHSWQGVVTMGLACSFAGILFDLCTFIRYEKLGGIHSEELEARIDSPWEEPFRS